MHVCHQVQEVEAEMVAGGLAERLQVRKEGGNDVDGPLKET